MSELAGWEACAFNPSTLERERQADLCEYNASLIYIQTPLYLYHDLLPPEKEGPKREREAEKTRRHPDC